MPQQGAREFSRNGSNLPNALTGTFSAYGDWDGGDGTVPIDLNQDTDFWIRQALNKASDVTSAVLSFQFAVAGGAYAAYGSNPEYGPIEKRDVTANFRGSDLGLLSNLYTYERNLLPNTEAFTTPVFSVSIDVTSQFNSLNNGLFYLDFGRNVPQYFTGAGYFVMDNASLVIGDAVVTPTSGVPEPATWALLITGFAAAGAGLRKRRKEIAAS